MSTAARPDSLAETEDLRALVCDLSRRLALFEEFMAALGRRRREETPKSPGDALAAVQARRREMHLVPAPARVRTSRPRRPPLHALRPPGGSS